MRRSTAIVAGFALFLIVIGLITNGLSGALVMAATFALFTGLYTLLTNRPSWARLAGRKAGAITAGAAVVALLIGGAVAPSDDAVQTASAEQATEEAEPATKQSTGTPSATAEPTASAKATQSAKPTPSPKPTATTSGVAPLDSDAVEDASGTPRAPSSQPVPNTTALALLKTLPIKGRAPKTGYDREQFGQAWADVDHNGCDTRNDMLNRDLTEIAYVNSVPCKVQSGVLDDPYTGTVIPFLRGEATSSDVQIDHVVALSDAWQKGAQQLTFDQRVAFANDPLNLQATDGPTNQQKGDGDAATWLPPDKSYRCEYVARQVSVKATYTLWVTQAEHDAMAGILSDCNGILAPTNQMAPSVTQPPAPVETEAPAPVVAEPVAPSAVEPAPVAPPVVEPVPVAPVPVAPAPVAPAPVAPAPAPAPFYQNCDAVRAAGAAPIRPGDPGFEPKFDGNGDGVGCE
ncbi:GmrSD restriction endonuclease domain-containing protein [Arthrobacter sp. MDT3-44]